MSDITTADPLNPHVPIRRRQARAVVGLACVCNSVRSTSMGWHTSVEATAATDPASTSLYGWMGAAAAAVAVARAATTLGEGEEVEGPAAPAAAAVAATVVEAIL